MALLLKMTDKTQKTKWTESRKARELVRSVIFEIAKKEGGHILHYNDLVDENWEEYETLYKLKNDFK